MNGKRSIDDERDHLLRKIRKLEKRILTLPESDDEGEKDKQDSCKENESPEIDEEQQLIQGFIEEEEVEEEDELDEEVLDILGIAPDSKPKKETLRKEIAERWTQIFEKGLKKEEKDELTNDNQPFENCPKMVAPKLNKEVAAALNDNAKKRDALIESRQKQLSTTLSCVGQAMQYCLMENIQENKLIIFKKINEAARLLCDVLYLDTKGRRTLILSTINKNLKEFLLETEPEEYLFGENLAEKIKAAKAVQKSGKDLKTSLNEEKKKKKPETTERKRTLNWRGPPRSTHVRKAGGPMYNRQRKPDDKKHQKK